MLAACSVCRKDKPLTDFSADPGKRNGRRSACKVCRAEQVKARRGVQPARHILTLMIQRCHNPKHPKFHHYGGRGIHVCAAWRAKGGFSGFLAEVGPRPSLKHSIERIKNHLGYEPGNVRWATQSEQMGNTRRTLRVDVGGASRCVTHVERETGNMNLARRVRAGMTIEQAIAKPVRATRRLITHNGETLNCHEWSLRLGGERSLVATRLYGGWSESDAVSVPAGQTRGWRKKGRAA